MKRKDAYNIAKRVLNQERFHHSLRTAECALKLADLFGGNKKKLYIAAMLHDTGYFVAKSKKDLALAHARISEMYARRIGIRDEKILDAIRWHTVGKANMSRFSKIIYLADAIEPGRHYEGVDEIRKLAWKDLDHALIRSVELQKKMLNKKGKRLSTYTVKMYHDLKK
ncbi:bis(5'-nucleosyl)-tetraphosphatase (symmetrical) YqeK [Guggenheimella bovis]